MRLAMNIHWHRQPAAFDAGTSERPLLARLSYRQVALAAALLVLAVAHQVYVATLPRTLVVQAALLDAAAATGALSPSANANQVRAALDRYFPNGEATVDPTLYPREVDVTFHDLDAATCRESARRIRRIEGNVVVQLVGYASPRDCGSTNAMTWRIMP